MRNEVLKPGEGTEFPTVRQMTAWVLDALRGRPPEDIATYRELTGILTIDAQSSRGRTAVLKAGIQLLREQQKLLVNVKNVGYRIAKANEHVDYSRRLQANGRRRLRRGAMIVAHVALGALTPEERAAVLLEQVRVGLSLSFASKIAKQKTLPKQEQIALPSGARLVKLLTRKDADSA
jgi:hypothetical protein